jgi:hypothetical protein
MTPSAIVPATVWQMPYSVPLLKDVQNDFSKYIYQTNARLLALNSANAAAFVFFYDSLLNNNPIAETVSSEQLAYLVSKTQ